MSSEPASSYCSKMLFSSQSECESSARSHAHWVFSNWGLLKSVVGVEGGNSIMIKVSFSSWPMRATLLRGRTAWPSLSRKVTERPRRKGTCYSPVRSHSKYKCGALGHSCTVKQWIIWFFFSFNGSEHPLFPLKRLSCGAQVAFTKSTWAIGLHVFC